jgi:hypothetical protein
MEAAADGARTAGGHTIGILPSYDRASANPHIEFAIATGMINARSSPSGRGVILPVCANRRTLRPPSRSHANWPVSLRPPKTATISLCDEHDPSDEPRR